VVTVKYKNALIALGLDDFEFKKEEKRRFELLEEHMDVEIYEVSSADWNKKTEPEYDDQPLRKGPFT